MTRSPFPVHPEENSGDAAASWSWMRSSLARALSVAMIGTIAFLHALLIVALSVSELQAAPLVPVLVHVLAIVALGAVLLLGLHSGIGMGAHLIALAMDLLIVTRPAEPLFSVSFILTPWTVVALILLFTGVAPVVWYVLVSVALTACIVIGHPGWEAAVPAAYLTGLLALGAAAVFFVRVLRRWAGEVDQQQQAAARQGERVMRARAINDAAVEFARLLHDTIVNTFAALSRADAERLDADEVRARCRSDIERLEQIRGARGERARREGLGEIESAGMLPVRRTGLSDADLRDLEVVLPDAVVLALRSCLAELLLNATKHSGADHADLDVRHDGDAVTVTFSDAGRGFDGTVVPGRGLAGSVFDRAAENGIRVELVTAPGEGTTVILRCAVQRPESRIAQVRTERPVGDFLRRATLSWSGLMLMVGLLTETVNGGGRFTQAHLALVLIGALYVLTVLLVRGGRALPSWAAAAIVIAIPVTNALALASAVGGRLYSFQAGAMGALIVLLFLARRHGFWFATGMGVLVASAVLTTWWMHRRVDVGVAVHALIVDLSITTVAIVWWLLRGMLARTARRLAAAAIDEKESRAQTAAYEASDAVLERWSAAGLQESIGLLARIADGAASVEDAEIRRRCGEEAERWRQIIALPADAALLGWWFARAQLESRKRDVELRIRAGGAQLHGTQEADALGAVLLDGIRHSAGGAALDVSLVQYRDAARLFMIGDLGEFPAPGDVVLERQDVGGRTILEAGWSRA